MSALAHGMKRACLLGLVFTFLACSSSGGDPDPTPAVEPPPADPPAVQPAPPADQIPARFQPIADAVQAEMKSLQAPGVAIAVIEKGEVTFAHGFGTKVPKKNVPVKATTLFRIGSVTKALTATAVLRLVADGKVSLDDSVTKSFPAFHFDKDATWAPAMTVRDLLNHTAGNVDAYRGTVDPLHTGDDELQRFFSQDWPKMGYAMFPAGRMFDYANPNFEIAGCVIERASGKMYRDYMKEAVFGPLGMSRTIFTADEIQKDGDVATGLATIFSSTGDPEPTPADSYDSPSERPAGFALSSVYDLAKFVKFVVKGDDKVLPSAQRIAMSSPQVDMLQALNLDHYGFGVEVYDYLQDPKTRDWYTLRAIGHSGAIPGFSAEWHYIPELDVGFVAMSNADGAYYENTWMSVLKTVGNLPAPSAKPSFASDPAKLPSYAGTYDDPNGVGKIVVTFESGQLKLQVDYFDKQHVKYGPGLTPLTPNNFVYDLAGQPDVVTFILDDAGKPEYFRTRSYVGHLSTATPDPGPAPIRPDPQLASRIVAAAKKNAPLVKRDLARFAP
jgi:CubicO group peptidase (beta-lactamase class C family)